MAEKGQCRTDPPTGISGTIYNAWTGDADAGLLELPVGSDPRNMVAAQIEAIADGIIAGAGGAGEFLFRLNPASVAQFGTGRALSGTAPTVAAAVDGKGRPYIRFTANSSQPSFVPLLDAAGAPIVGTGRFRIEMRAIWSGRGSNQMLGVGVNAHNTTGTQCFAVTNVSSAVNQFDFINAATVENFTVFNQLATDASFEWPVMHVDVWLNPATGHCTVTYSSARDTRSDFQQRRKTALAVTGGTAIGLYSQGNTGYLDVAELIVRRNERDW